MGSRRGWGLGRGLGSQRGVEGLRRGLVLGAQGLRWQLEVSEGWGLGGVSGH